MRLCFIASSSRASPSLVFLFSSEKQMFLSWVTLMFLSLLLRKSYPETLKPVEEGVGLWASGRQKSAGWGWHSARFSIKLVRVEYVCEKRRCSGNGWMRTHRIQKDPVTFLSSHSGEWRATLACRPFLSPRHLFFSFLTHFFQEMIANDLVCLQPPLLRYVHTHT